MMAQQNTKKKLNKFDFSIFGDINKARPTLNGGVHTLQYRILRLFGMGLGLDQIIGTKASNGIQYTVGKNIGKQLVQKKIIVGKNKKELLASFVKAVINFKIGIPSIIKQNKNLPLIIRIDECINCSGMKNINRVICFYEAGIIAGVLSNIFNKKLDAIETKCNAKGDKYCEFKIIEN